MTRWTVDAPTALDFDDVTGLNVRLMGGTVAVLASDDRPSLAVSELSGRPLQVSHSGGILTVSYDSLSWDGQSTSGAVRTEFEALRTVKAPASHTVSGNVGAGTGHVSVTTMSGTVTLLRRAPVGMESKTQ